MTMSQTFVMLDPSILNFTKFYFIGRINLKVLIPEFLTSEWEKDLIDPYIKTVYKTMFTPMFPDKSNTILNMTERRFYCIDIERNPLLCQ